MKYYCLFFIFLVSCNKYPSEISIYSNLQEGDSISVALFSKITGHYSVVNGVSVSSTNVVHRRVDIPLPDSIFQDILAFSVTIHCHSDSILAISSIRLKDYGVIYPKEIMNTFWWWQDGLMFEIPTKSNTLISPIDKNIPGTFPISITVFFKSYPTGLQLFFRISLIATFFIFIFILCKQAPIQRFHLFTIALFLASLPLKIDYTIYSMSFMILSIIFFFVYNKSRRFMWTPIFYVLCAMYLINIIGLIYTDDFNLGIKRLDTNIALLLFPVIFSMIQFPKMNMVLLLRFFVWSVIVFCVFGFLSYVTIVPELTLDMVFRESKLYSLLLMKWPTHPHPSYLSTILLMAVPVTIYLFYSKIPKFQNSKIKITETLLGVLLPIVFTFLSGARIGMVIAPVLLGLGYLFYCRFRPVLKWGLIVFGIAALGIMLHLFPKADDRFVDPIRADLRKTAISAIKEKPIFGWGTGYVEPLIISEERAHSLNIETPYDFNQFHNQYLEDMVQFGILGILLILVLFGWMLWTGVREKNYLLLSLLVIYAFFCWTETVFFVAKGVIPFTFWFCFLISNRTTLMTSKKSLH